MRPFTLIAAAVVALAWSGLASAALPERGFVVYKETRTGSLTEVRLKGTGLLVHSAKTLPAPKTKKHAAPECTDAAHADFGLSWQGFEPYVVNAASFPANLHPQKTLVTLRKSHEAWEHPFTTDCKKPKDKSRYRSVYGGTTASDTSLVADLAADGRNVVAFRSLAGTICDGATACVVIDYEGDRILEADLAFERDLTRYGFEDYWTNDDRTWWDDTGGRWSVADVATHEFGHWAGLDHVWESPELTMFPWIHDGAQTLGLGDMLGVLSLY